ncbi:MAG: DoxX family protein [Acidobacteriota bacterium]|nr:DoxX family protein [Acidobacteriota bacterium]MDH3530002.1 DoxX family protein [Acidobacteriota bacterium]
MINESGNEPVSKGMLWAGRIISGAFALMLIFSATMKFIQPDGFSEGIKHLGWDDATMTYVGVVELLCVVLYLVPRTAILGAILVAAYLGGATATHVRVADPFFSPVLVGIAAWLGLWLRDKRLRELLPLG